jgi:predicted transcriptional regulator
MPKKRVFDQYSMRPLMGPLEREAMQVLWSGGELSVRQVMQRLPAKRAYTTVMTTVTRLFTKGILKRRAWNRKFLYSPRITIEEWQQSAARAATARFLATPCTPRDLLVSCLLATVAQEGYKGRRTRTHKERPAAMRVSPAKNSRVRNNTSP